MVAAERIADVGPQPAYDGQKILKRAELHGGQAGGEAEKAMVRKNTLFSRLWEGDTENG